MVGFCKQPPGWEGPASDCKPDWLLVKWLSDKLLADPSISPLQNPLEWMSIGGSWDWKASGLAAKRRKPWFMGYNEVFVLPRQIKWGAKGMECLVGQNLKVRIVNQERSAHSSSSSYIDLTQSGVTLDQVQIQKSAKLKGKKTTKLHNILKGLNLRTKDSISGRTKKSIYNCEVESTFPKIRSHPHNPKI